MAIAVLMRGDYCVMEHKLETVAQINECKTVTLVTIRINKIKSALLSFLNVKINLSILNKLQHPG